MESESSRCQGILLNFNPLSANIIFDNGKAAGYGFVSFGTKEEAEAALSELDGKVLHTNICFYVLQFTVRMLINHWYINCCDDVWPNKLNVNAFHLYSTYYYLIFCEDVACLLWHISHLDTNKTDLSAIISIVFSFILWQAVKWKITRLRGSC